MRHLSLPPSSLLSHHLTLCKLVWVLNICINVTLISRILKQGKGVSEKEKRRRWCVEGGVVPYPGATVVVCSEPCVSCFRPCSATPSHFVSKNDDRHLGGSKWSPPNVKGCVAEHVRNLHFPPTRLTIFGEPSSFASEPDLRLTAHPL
jgi:hypothetical protein